jgi:hypothetical protein
MNLIERQLVIGWAAAWVGLVSPGSGAAAEPAAPQSARTVACSSTSTGGDLRAFTCPLGATGTLQRFRFKANFSGGHDDTMASLTATLNGAPFACDAGSKTRLMGEDGEVSLECRISIQEKAGTQHVLGIVLLWSHAQYTDVELVSE